MRKHRRARTLKTNFSRGMLIAVCVILRSTLLADAATVKTNFAGAMTSDSITAVWVAKEQGIFQKHGLDLQYVVMPNGTLTITALLSGEIDMGLGGPGHILDAAVSGVDVICIANFFHKLDFTLTGRPEIKKPADLRGKKITTSGPGSTSHMVTLLALQSLDLEPKQAKINLVTIPGTEINRRLALESGAVDATALRGAIGDLYSQKGYPALFNFRGSGVTMPQTLILTTRRTATNRPQLVEAYLKALIEGIASVVEPANKEVVSRILATKLRLSNPADVEKVYQSVSSSYERIPYPNLDGMKKLHSILTSTNPKLATVRPETVMDASFINKLEHSGFIQSVYKKR
jgi:ABC-type nitrate/sulfonate/bicarbonate transport system substrate-binding protein